VKTIISAYVTYNIYQHSTFIYTKIFKNHNIYDKKKNPSEEQLSE